MQFLQSASKFIDSPALPMNLSIKDEGGISDLYMYTGYIVGEVDCTIKLTVKQDAKYRLPTSTALSYIRLATLSVFPLITHDLIKYS